MPKKLRKSLRIYFSKLKKIPSLTLPHPPTTNSLLSACKYPKTPSFAADRHIIDVDDAAATLSDVDRFLHENFHSLYLHDNDDDDGISDRRPKPSGRSFVSPGRTTSSLLTSSTSSSSRPSETELAVPGDGVAVMTFSKDPYDDFRRSMREMVDSWHVDPRQPLDWDFMEELLFCYLELNDRSVHKHILKAFTDLTAGFQRRVPVAMARGRRRRRRKVHGDLETTGNSGQLTEMAPQEKVKECYYYDHRKHMET